MKENFKKITPYLVLIGLLVIMAYLVRINYVWVGFVDKDQYMDTNNLKGEISALEIENTDLHSKIQAHNEAAMEN
jgi:hypothetical protein